jgi:PleD family two-component response regulator
MAEGAIANSEGNVSLSTTGIAGLTGAVPGKPIGTVCFGWVVGGVTHTERLIFTGDRHAYANKQSHTHWRSCCVTYRSYKLSFTSARIRALLVDDDAEIGILLCKYLEKFDIHCTAVGDGSGMREALSHQTFDVVLLDLMLPGEDSLTLLRHVRNRATSRSSC